MLLDKDQAQALRDRFDEQAKGIHQGGIPILTGGLDVKPFPTTAPRDAQLVELMRMSAEDIAHAFGVPLPLIIVGGTFNSTHELIALWWRTGLGALIELIEQAYDLVAGLRGFPHDYTEFDTDALLRAAPRDHIEMLVRGVQGGVFSPNEARGQLGYDAVDFGSEPRVQQQVVPLSAAGAIPAAPAAPAAAPVPVRSRAERRAALADMVERNLGDR